VFVRASRELDEPSAEILFRGEGVVRTAAEREVGFGVLATQCEGLQVVQVDAPGFMASPSRGVGVGAASLVALEDGPADGGGDVSAAPAGLLGLVRSLVVIARAASVSWLGRSRRAASALPRARGHGTLLPFELGHEGAHRTQVDLVDGGAGSRM
jgi:hypothetical protein